MTNFGRRPTIGTPSVRSETCILGFSGDLYGTDTEVHLLEFLRAEKKFDGLSSLSAQIKADSESAVKIFENTIANRRDITQIQNAKAQLAFDESDGGLNIIIKEG